MPLGPHNVAGLSRRLSWSAACAAIVLLPSGVTLADPPHSNSLVIAVSKVEAEPADGSVIPAPPEAIAAAQPLPETGPFIPADPTTLPAAPLAPPAHAYGGCSCAACRGGVANGPPPGFAPSPGWFNGACPKPVLSEGWCRRPYYFDFFGGAISGNELVDNEIAQHTSFLGGVRLGLDFDESWGVEGRVAWSEVEITNTQGLSLERTADLLLWDVSLVHYFASDLRLRPFVSIGVGAADWEFVDANGLPADEKVIGVPIGIGVKQRYDDWLVIRLDMTDNIAFGGGTVLGTQHNFSIAASFEIRFGGPRTSYWPWQPRKYYSW